MCHRQPLQSQLHLKLQFQVQLLSLLQIRQAFQNELQQ